MNVFEQAVLNAERMARIERRLLHEPALQQCEMIVVHDQIIITVPAVAYAEFETIKRILEDGNA